MKVKISFTIDIDNQAFTDRFHPGEPDDTRRRDTIIRDDVRGLAATAVIHQLLGGHTEDGGVLHGYTVKEWA